MAARNVDPMSPFEPTVVEALWRYWWVVLTSIVSFGALAFGFLSQQTPGWVAEAALVVEDPRAAALFEPGAFLRPERYVENQVEILESPAVAQRASELTERLDARELLVGLSVGIRGSSDLITVSFTRPDAETAVEGANAIAAAYQDVRRSEAVRSFSAAVAELDASISDIEAELSQTQDDIDEFRRSNPVRVELEDQYQDALARLAALQRSSGGVEPAEYAIVQIRLEAMERVLRIEADRPRQAALLEEQRRAIDRLSDLTARRDQLEVEAELAGGGVVFFSPADEAFQLGTGRIRVMGLGVVLGFLVGAVLAYFLALRRRRFTDRSEPELVLGAALLGDIPDFREERLWTPVPVRDAPLSAAAEASRFVAATLTLRRDRAEHPEARPRSFGSVAVTSALLRDGKSVVLVNVAVAAAFQGRRVLVIDADFGHQNATDLLLPDAPPGPGLTEVVAGLTSVTEAAVPVEFEQPADLRVLSRGRQIVTAPDFFNSIDTQDFLSGVRDEFDLVLVDTPPLLQVAYASTLVGSVDRVVVVVPHGGKIQPADELRQRLELIGTPFAGYVYNRSPGRRLPAGEGSLADVLGTLPTEPTRRHFFGRRKKRLRRGGDGAPASSTEARVRRHSIWRRNTKAERVEEPSDAE